MSRNANEAARRIGIVGAGNIVRMHMQGIQRHPAELAVVAVCDPDAARLKDVAKTWEIPHRYETVERMLAGETLDAAVVLTPTHVRRQVLLPLMEAGVPVLCEKPLAETYGEAVTLADEADRLKATVAVNQNFRRFFTFEMARGILATGRLGRPLHLIQSALWKRRDKGWRLDRDRYVMAVMSIHWFDGYRFLLNEEPLAVSCLAPRTDSSAGGETAVSVTLTFPGGTVVDLSESFSSFVPHAYAQLDCEKGSLILDYKALIEVDAEGNQTEHPNPCDKPEATVSLLLDLCAAASEGRRPLTDIRDNVNSMRIMEAAYRSLDEGRPVRLEDIR